MDLEGKLTFPIVWYSVGWDSIKLYHVPLSKIVRWNRLKCVRALDTQQSMVQWSMLRQNAVCVVWYSVCSKDSKGATLDHPRDYAAALACWLCDAMDSIFAFCVFSLHAFLHRTVLHRTKPQVFLHRAIDLHGLHVAEAVEVLDEQIAALSDRGVEGVRVLTGTGHHSRGPTSKVFF